MTRNIWPKKRENFPSNNGDISGKSIMVKKPVATKAIMVSCNVAIVPGIAWSTTIR